MNTTALIGFGLTGQCLYQHLLQKQDTNIIIFDPCPLLNFQPLDRQSSSLPFDPETSKSSRSKHFGGWVDSPKSHPELNDLKIKFETLSNPSEAADPDLKLLAKATMTDFDTARPDIHEHRILRVIQDRNGFILETQDENQFKANRIISTVPPQTLANWLFLIDPTLYGELTCHEHAVRSVLIAYSSDESKSTSFFIKPIHLGQNQYLGAEVVGPQSWSNLSEETQNTLQQNNIKGQSYTVMHFFWSGNFVRFKNGMRFWNFEQESQNTHNNMNTVFDKCVQAMKGSENNAIILRNFHEDVGLFHQSALKNKNSPMFDATGCLLNLKQFHCLGSPLIEGLRGTHPTLEILAKSVQAIKKIL